MRRAARIQKQTTSLTNRRVKRRHRLLRLEEKNPAERNLGAKGAEGRKKKVPGARCWKCRDRGAAIGAVGVRAPACSWPG